MNDRFHPRRSTGRGRARSPWRGAVFLNALFVLGGLLVGACDDGRTSRKAAEKDKVADAVYVGGRIWTGNPENPWAEALATAGEELLAVGSNEEIEALAGDGTRRVELAGHLVVPGFIDSHTHFLGGGRDLASVDLRDADSPEEFTRRLGDFAAEVGEGRWITGGNWDHEAWGGELPRREWIDEATGDVPVFVNRLDGHMALANSTALQLAGIDADTPDPEGGTIVRDPVTGEPTGVLKDNAMNLVSDARPDLSAAEDDAALDAAMRLAASKGVTQVHDMVLNDPEQWGQLEVYRRARAEGRLTVRILAGLPLASWERLAAYRDEHGSGDEWLRWGLLKGFVDGSLGSTTAWFYEPYSDAPETSGLQVGGLDTIADDVRGADAAGLQVAVHAIGDRANDALLDLFAEVAEANGPRDRRFRVEHAQHLRPDTIGRFADLGVIASMQPYHAIDDGRWAEKRIGPERIRTTYAFRDLLDTGAHLAFGSDWPVAPLDPLAAVYAAVTRRTLDGANPDGWVPEQRITVEETLRAHTAGSAYAGFQEERLGTLEAGKLADFVELSEDLFEIEPGAIRDVEVVRTVVGGRVVYSGAQE